MTDKPKPVLREIDVLLAELKGAGAKNTLRGVIGVCELEIEQTLKEIIDTDSDSKLRELQGRVRGIRKIVRLLEQIS